MLELILGGARSGKSRLAEERALKSGKQRVYIATAQAGDEEMMQRIKQHQERRDSSWQLVEEPLALATTLVQEAKEDRCLLVDCLTLWLNNHLQQPEGWAEERHSLLAILPTLPGHIILVGNEVGAGIIPLGEITRHFVDENGWLHQDLAKICDHVTLTVAGLAHTLKDTRPLEAS